MKKTATLLFALLSFAAYTAVETSAQVLADGQPSLLQDDKPSVMTSNSVSSVPDSQPAVLKEDRAQSNYVYDLKVLIQKSRENIKNVNEKIKEQAVQKRNQQREEKAREYFLQAQKLAEEGRLEESRELYDKAIRITEHPEMKYYIKESEHRTKVQEAALSRQEGEQQRRMGEEEKGAFERVENMYQGAVSLYKQQRFKEAKEEFQTVEEVFPDYKAVRSYLQIIEQDIVQSERQSIKDQRKEIDNQQKEAEIARLREKELWRKEIDRKEEDRKKKLAGQAQGVYDDAIKLYQDRKYMAAKEKFQEVEWVVPDFKATRSYLQRIEHDIETDKSRITQEREKTVEKQRWEETLAQKKAEEDRKKAMDIREHEKLDQKKDQAEFVYQSAIALFNKDQMAQARDKFDEVESIYPDYKSTRDYQKRINDLTKTAKEREEELRKAANEKKIWEEAANKRKEEKENFQKLTEEADSFYNEAFDYYKMGRLIEAKEKFLEVDKRVPDYKTTRSYLKKIDDDIAAMVTAHRKGDELATQKEDLARLKEVRDKADLSYNEAIVAYDNKEYAAAKAKFRETEAIYPNYKKAASYLSRIDDDIKAQAEMVERQAREKKAEDVFVQAAALYDSEQYEEAKSKFVEVVSIIPDHKKTSYYLERIDDDIIRKKEKNIHAARERQAQMLYNQATALYQSTEFEQAKVKFLELETVVPSYQDTPKYLANIDGDIQRKKLETDQRIKAEQADEVYKQALALYQAGDFESAKEKFVRVEVIYPDYKDTSKFLATIDGDIQRKNREADLKRKSDEAEPLYVQAVDLYKAQQFGESKMKLLQVQVACPNYKDTARYLSRVDEDIRLLEERLAKEDKERRAEALYTEALKKYSERNFEEAKKKFLEVMTLVPAYRNVKNYLGHIDNDIRDELARVSRQLHEEQAEKPYAKAVEDYHAGNFEAAKNGFTDVVKVLPDYKKAKSYLARIDSDIRQQQKERSRERSTNAELAYQEAVALYTKGDILKAYQKFGEVESLYPDFKITHKYLAQAKEALAGKGVVLPGSTNVVPEVVAKPSAAVPSSSQQGISDDAILELYKAAVNFYKDKQLPQAREKFEEVQRLHPNYRSVGKYLDAINVVLPKPVIEAPAPVLQVTTEAPVPAIPAPGIVQKDLPSLETYERTVAAAEPLYSSAVDLYKSGKFDEALVKFQQVKLISKDYKSTQEYLLLIAKSRGEKVPAEAKQELARESKTIEELSQRSGELYRQIRALADDKDMAGAAKTFAKVDKILENLEMEKKRLAQEIERQEKESRLAAERAKALEEEQRNAEKLASARREALKQKQEDKKEEEAKAREAANLKEQNDLKRQERERIGQAREQERDLNLKAGVFYQQGLGALKEKNYPLAKERFNDARKLWPEFKDTGRLLLDIDRAEGEQKLLEEEDKDHARAAALAEKANAVNMEALALSNNKDFAGLQQKFDELSSVLKEIQILKGRMISRREGFRVEWENKLAALKNKASSGKPVKGMKEIIEGRTVRQQAEAIYKEGQDLYNVGQYAEARVKFRDSFAVDPSFKAAYTFAQRVDRLFEQKDYEDQKARNKKEGRGFESKQEGTEAALIDKTPATPDPVRAKQVEDEGLNLYKTKRFKEARIKFEELAKVGDARQHDKAVRYFGLIETALEKEQQATEAERRKEEERYLEAKRAEIRLSWEKDKNAQAQQISEAASLSQHSQEITVERQILLRSIEQENNAERKRMLMAKIHQQDLDERKAVAVHAQVRQVAANQGVWMEGAPLPVAGKPDEIKRPPLPASAAHANSIPAKQVKPAAVKQEKPLPVKTEKPVSVNDVKPSPVAEASPVPVKEEKQPAPLKEEKPAVIAQVTAVPTDVKVERDSRQKMQVKNPKRKPLVVATDNREDQKFQELIAQQRVIQERDEHRKKIAEERQRQAQELEKMRFEEKKRRAEEALIRRNQKEVALSINVAARAQKAGTETKVRKDAPMPKEIKTAQVEQVNISAKELTPQPAAPEKTVESDHKDVLQAAANEERRLLEEQRAAIARDFEQGVERLYVEAQALYKKRVYDEARADFEQVDELIKGYKKTAQYLKQLEKEIPVVSTNPQSIIVIPSSSKSNDQQQAVSHVLDNAEAGSAR
ncbi:MAG: hypothetical protein HQL22_02465 [Candidatus Omnitrophica bacterium]|nr:hypothetical protein [Candidatus Omnitrophota bacterium]